MKIEMGESLFYSWLRHVKECQIVQTNWKVSPQWDFQHEDQIASLVQDAAAHFSSRYGYNIFKGNRSLSQILRQGECDALGISFQSGVSRIYAVDVAFHGDGLNYGSKEETVMKVIAKSIRTAACLYGYLDTTNAEIIFASPKINPATLKDLSPCVEDVNMLFQRHGFEFSMRIIANTAFNDAVLQPILLLSEGIADTSELFVRSYQMFTMFADAPETDKTPPVRKEEKQQLPQSTDAYKELKVGKLAQVVLRKMLEDGAAGEDEVRFMQQSAYSKQFFGLNYPLLVRADAVYEKVRYYAAPLVIRGEQYMMCSQWFETPANNDRPYLLHWIESHR